LNDQIEATEGRIESRERELADLETAMQAAAERKDAGRISEIGRAIHDCQKVIEADFGRLERLTEELEALQDEFDARFAALAPDETPPP
jgi:predicted  nucleic acid-binding Zn-ribbon protein